ncbi:MULTISPECIES: hypothetical protein [Streptomyces]|uniref:Uncharacterized protein n=1 Tax=Streptomyces venezuelae TaxID=54571 RepID=A0A5P2BGW5_STRVZ|nr:MULTISPECIES: hypothetical protein [Streptomyces]NEA05940.1 hypothetical protein [Streptomyces sp. SID10116]MYY80429.1 hypothetical protein [Streptomyces sp. SID335]MYZ15405.1 hypothetical protein [Streptomyces sp. SID337]NDZ86934.1 hypothetical protein [Streptomyces sp. SID10115]NEB44389.1 hypothetical protein [Streptomyces sp. SID339]
MKHRQRLAGGVLAAATLLGATLATPAASAATTATATASATSGTAPACVKRDVVKHRKYVKVTNLCGHAMHLKVVIDWGNDSPCLTYQNKEQWEWNWGRGSYGKVVTC